MDYSRMIGNNITIELDKHNLSPAILESLGYTGEKLGKLLEGRLFLALDDLAAIADTIGTQLDSLTKLKEPQEYMALTENMGYCENLDEQDFIFDMFNMYADLKEAIKR